MTTISDPVPSRRGRRRAVTALPLLATAALLSACGGGGGNQPTPTAHASSTSSDNGDSSTDDSATGSTDITVGDQVFSSTLKTPTQDFGVKGSNIHEDSSGITLDVANAGGGYTYSTPLDFHGIPDNLDVSVQIDEPQRNDLYAGVACRGLDDKNTYLLLVDAKGDYAIVQVKAGNQTLLKKGDAAFSVSWPITLEAACVTPDGDSNTNRLSLSANGTDLATVDDSIDNVAGGNSYAIFAVSPSADTGTGSVLFHDLTVSSASSQ